MNTTSDKPPANAQERSVQSSRIAAIVACALGAVAIAVALYAWYRVEVSARIATGELTTAVRALERAHERVDSEQQSLRERLDSDIATSRGRFDSALTELAEESRTHRRGLSDELEALDQRVEGLSESVQRVHAELGRSLDTWTLEEVEQLMVLANHRLRLAGDVELAIAALDMADQRLRDLGDPGLDDVRTVLAEEVLALRSVSELDVPGAAARLAGLIGQVDRLAQRADPDLSAPGAADEALGDDATDWRRVGRAVFEDLAGLVSVRRTDSPTQPLLPPEQGWFLRENLRLALQAAQIALMRGDAATYASQLGRADDWVAGHFIADSEPVVAMQAELASLAALEIAPELPDISASLRALRAAMAARAAQ